MRGTCRCQLCGAKNANTHKGRGLYVRYGIRCDEYLYGDSDQKFYGKRKLRRRLNMEARTWESIA